MQLKALISNYLQRRFFGYGPNGDFSYVDSFQGPAVDIKLLGMYSGVAYRCIDDIAEAMGSKYEPYLYTKNAKGMRTTVPSHPFFDVLMNPNEGITFYELIEGSQSFVEQFGEFFWYMVPGQKTGYANGVKEIYLMRPDKMGIVIDKDTGDVLGYNYNTGAGKKIPFTPEEIMHFKKFNPKNPYRGFSTLQAALDYIVTEQEVSRFTSRYFHNNAALSGILTVDGKISRENWNKFVRQWRERYQGVENAGKVALLRESQAKFTSISSSISDMQLKDLKETTVDQILMMFKIPKGMFGMESDQGLGRASVETLEYIFAKWTMTNKMERFDDFLLRCIKKYYPKDSAYFCDHISIVPDDKEFMLQVYDKGVDRWLTREEIRSQDPLTANTEIPGSNQLFTTLQQMPLEAAGTQEPADGNDNEPDDDESKSVTRIVVKSKKKDLEYSTQQKEAYRLSVERNAAAYSRKYKQTFNGVLKDQRQRVIKRLKHLAGKSLADQLLSLAEESDQFNKDLMPVLEALILEQGQLALIFSGSESDVKYKMSEAIKNAMQKSTKKMAQNFNSETADQLAETISEGLQDGESISDLTDRVNGVYDQAEGYRAERIARTESQYASNSATLDAYKQNPVVTSMQWFANPGACPYCDALDGTVVGLDDTFVAQGDSVDTTDDNGNSVSYQADYGDVNNPPLHPNCSCTIIPVTK